MGSNDWLTQGAGSPSKADHGAVVRMLSAARSGTPAHATEVPDEVCELYAAAFTLVRPDGHVAWRGDDIPAEPASIWAVVTGG